MTSVVSMRRRKMGAGTVNQRSAALLSVALGVGALGAATTVFADNLKTALQGVGAPPTGQGDDDRILAGMSSEDADQGFAASIERAQTKINQEVELDELRRASREEVAGFLRQAGESAVAGDYAAARAALEKALGAAAKDDDVTRNRVVLAQASLKLRQHDLGGAEGLLKLVEEDPALSPSQRQRISTLRHRLTDSKTDAARRALIEEISGLGLKVAIERARDGVKADPANFTLRLRLADLLDEAGDAKAARKVVSDLRVAAAAANRPDVSLRAVALLVDMELHDDRIDGAVKMLAELRAAPDTPAKPIVLARAEQRIGRAKTKLAERLAKERVKEIERLAKEKERAEREALKAEIDRIEALPTGEGVRAAADLYARRQGDDDVGLAYARLLSRDMQWVKSEQVYKSLLGPEGTTTDANLVAKPRATLGLVDLYVRSNRLAEASALLKRLETGYGATSGSPLERMATLRGRVDRYLAPFQFRGSVTAVAGYDTNVSATNALEDDLGNVIQPGQERGSGLLGVSARTRADIRVNPNGDSIRLQGRLDGFHYWDVPTEDRTTYDVSIGYVHKVVGTSIELQALVGRRTRFDDYMNVRRTVFGSLIANGSLTRDIKYSGTVVVEQNDDDDPRRSGWALNPSAGLRYDPTDRDRFTAVASFRYEDAKASYEDKTAVGLLFGYRRLFDVGQLRNLSLDLSYSPGFTKYLSTFPGSTLPKRRDFDQRFSIAIGKQIAPDWRMEGRVTHSRSDSNQDFNDDKATRFTVSLTKLFSYPAPPPPAVTPGEPQPGAPASDRQLSIGQQPGALPSQLGGPDLD